MYNVFVVCRLCGRNIGVLKASSASSAVGGDANAEVFWEALTNYEVIAETTPECSNLR